MSPPLTQTDAGKAWPLELPKQSEMNADSEPTSHRQYFVQARGAALQVRLPAAGQRAAVAAQDRAQRGAHDARAQAGGVTSTYRGPALPESI